MFNVVLLERLMIHIIYSYSNTSVFLLDRDQSQCVSASLSVGANVSMWLWTSNVHCIKPGIWQIDLMTCALRNCDSVFLRQLLTLVFQGGDFYACLGNLCPLCVLMWSWLKRDGLQLWQELGVCSCHPGTWWSFPALGKAFICFSGNGGCVTSLEGRWFVYGFEGDRIEMVYFIVLTIQEISDNTT